MPEAPGGILGALGVGAQRHAAHVRQLLERLEPAADQVEAVDDGLLGGVLGNDGLVGHECILDLRELTDASGVTAADVAKRLIDYGFHAPTLSFPVAGTLMVEPTESEDLEEIERFITAMIAIRAEIQQVADGAFSAEDSPLRNAPHTAPTLAASTWDRPYSREQAAFPVPSLHVDKYFPPVSRIDGAAGDRNLICSCPPIEEFAH